jgi:hypothetical protein
MVRKSLSLAAAIRLRIGDRRNSRATLLALARNLAERPCPGSTVSRVSSVEVQQ